MIFDRYPPWALFRAFVVNGAILPATIALLTNLYSTKHDRYAFWALIIIGTQLTAAIALIIVSLFITRERYALVARNTGVIMFRVSGFSTLLFFVASLFSLFPTSEPLRFFVLLSIMAYMVYHLFQYIAPGVFMWAWSLREHFISKHLSLSPLRFRSSKDSGLITFAHASDLHLTSDVTLEGDLTAAAVTDISRRSISWLIKRASLVFFTGDITDHGRPEEWGIFLSILKEANLTLDSGRILIVPGNHDLSLTSEVLMGVDNIIEYDRRAFAFIENVLAKCPADWTMNMGGEWVSVREYLDDRAEYLQLYKKKPPICTLPGSGISPQIMLDPDVLNTASKYDGQGWPSSRNPLCISFLEMAYPMIMKNETELLVIGLNSNNIVPKTIVESAIGLLGEGQLNRLRNLLSGASSQCVFVLLHHHLGFPPEKRKEYEAKYKEWQINALALLDASKLLEVLSPLRRCYVFHGHKHFPYQASFSNIRIVSADSIIYGPEEGKSGCAIYQLTTGGELTVVEHCPIR